MGLELASQDTIMVSIALVFLINVVTSIRQPTSSFFVLLHLIISQPEKDQINFYTKKFVVVCFIVALHFDVIVMQNLCEILSAER